MWWLTPKHPAKLSHSQKILKKRKLGEEKTENGAPKDKRTKDMDFSTSKLLAKIESQVVLHDGEHLDDKWTTKKAVNYPDASKYQDVWNNWITDELFFPLTFY